MRKIIKITVLLLIINSTFLIHYSTAQWIQQYTGTTADFHSVKFINKYTGWVCGTGVIAKTTNAGVNWIFQTHPATNKMLTSINPIDTDIIYCVGWYETILKTTNGGLNWFAIRNGSVGNIASYNASYFINKNTGWIGGTHQKVLRTTTGGITFDSSIINVGFIKDIYFKDSLTGLLCGEGGSLKKTTNGGYNWYTPNIELHYIGYNFNELSFINDQYGWLIGQTNPVYRSTDFGENWDSISYITEGYEIYCVHFSSINTGWCGGGGVYQGRLFKTTDSGFTWYRQQNVNIQGYVDEICFYNNSIGWAVGGNGMILHTTNGGTSNIENISSNIPEIFSLFQNFPNPFNSQTTIVFDIKKKGSYRLIVYDCLGRKRDEIFNEYMNAGSYSVSFNGDELQSGVYFYRLSADGKVVDTRKMVLIK